MIRNFEIYRHEWPDETLCWKAVAGYLCMWADSQGKIEHPHEHFDIFDCVSLALNLNSRRVKAIMGHMREIGLLRYERSDEWKDAKPKAIYVIADWDGANSHE